jgi:hypothetical protein
VTSDDFQDVVPDSIEQNDAARYGVSVDEEAPEPSVHDVGGVGDSNPECAAAGPAAAAIEATHERLDTPFD